MRISNRLIESVVRRTLRQVIKESESPRYKFNKWYTDGEKYYFSEVEQGLSDGLYALAKEMDDEDLFDSNTICLYEIGENGMTESYEERFRMDYDSPPFGEVFNHPDIEEISEYDLPFEA